MAKAKQKLKVLYHTFICDDNCGEAEGFFELTKGKLTLITSWSANDANWRGEYMTGLINYFGGKIEQLPEKHEKEASLMVAQEWGLIGREEEDEEEEEREEIDLKFHEGNSKKFYHLSRYENDEGWVVETTYGRIGTNGSYQVKCEGETYETAKKIYNKTLKEKINKGYKIA